jgi:hypothetical protein
VLELESGEGLVVSDLGGLEIFWERGEGVLVDAKGETQLAPGIELQR